MLVERFNNEPGSHKPRFLLNRFLYRVMASGLVPKGGKVLELGVGGGVVGMSLWGKGDYEYIPTDRFVGEKYPYTIPDAKQFDIFDTNSPFFVEDSVDSIISSQVFEHVYDPFGAVRNTYRLLKVGGILVFTTPFWYKIHSSGTGSDIIENDMGDFWRFTPDGIELLLYNAGYREYETGMVLHKSNNEGCPEHCIALARKTNDRDIKRLEFDVPLPDNWHENLSKWEEDYKRRIGRL